MDGEKDSLSKAVLRPSPADCSWSSLVGSGPGNNLSPLFLSREGSHVAAVVWCHRPASWQEPFHPVPSLPCRAKLAPCLSIRSSREPVGRTWISGDSAPLDKTTCTDISEITLVFSSFC